MPTQGRNEKCHCGSGRKFKKCHGLKTDEQRTARFLMIVVGGVLATAVVVGITSFRANDLSGSSGRTLHGDHYHDASGQRIP